jgi:hypothetical protein
MNDLHMHRNMRIDVAERDGLLGFVAGTGLLVIKQ